MPSIRSGEPRFTVEDLEELSDAVASGWISASEREWSARAASLDWTCLHAADHAVDCVYAPAFFLASRRTDRYPEVGLDLTLGDRATPARLVESLGIATRLLAGVIRNTPDYVRAVIFRRPDVWSGDRHDFAPRAALELALHAHDVALGLTIPFAPDAGLAHRLREHTRPWPMWMTATAPWGRLANSDEPWHDLLYASGRAPAAGG